MKSIKKFLSILVLGLIFGLNSILAVENISFNGKIVDGAGEGISGKVIKISIGTKDKYVVTDSGGNFTVSVLKADTADQVKLNIDENEAIIDKVPQNALILGYDQLNYKITSTSMEGMKFNMKKEIVADSYVPTIWHGWVIFNFALLSIGGFVFFRFLLSDKKKTEYSPYKDQEL